MFVCVCLAFMYGNSDTDDDVSYPGNNSAKTSLKNSVDKDDFAFYQWLLTRDGRMLCSCLERIVKKTSSSLYVVLSLLRNVDISCVAILARCIFFDGS